VVLGKSGSGKSITIKCVVGLVGADSGVMFVGTDITKIDTNELNEIRVRMVFFSNAALYDSMSVRKFGIHSSVMQKNYRQKKLKIR
jgi:phospholipid/cholesterol/gamma-HCH transport system ATP-binding protein